MRPSVPQYQHTTESGILVELLGGSCFAVAGAGESHGPGIPTIVSGCPAGLRLSRSDLQQQLDRRRPGSSKLGTPRRERAL